MFDNLSNNEKLLAGFIMLLAIVGLTEGNPLLFIFMALIAGVYGFRYLYQDDADLSDLDERHVDSRRSRRRPPNRNRVYHHALDAVRNAGRDPDDLIVLPVDIGLLSFHGDDEPVIHRSYPVADDSDYVQPFVQLRLPTAAVGKVRFEIYDNTSTLIFVNENEYQLNRGRNLIVPSTRLPVHDEQEFDGAWSLKVVADGVSLANHDFIWAEAASIQIQQRMGDDGEITSEMRAALAESRLERMGLDELLAFQDEDSLDERARL